MKLAATALLNGIDGMGMLAERDPVDHLVQQAVAEAAESESVERAKFLANRIAQEVSKLLPKGK